ncbi:hypothetical protein [Flavobacterium hiemivividum]|uniref:Lysoplasmalogenase n=1 Tax=Flavobacterium hiemivividum TaxID=2541734 RepID=A0A4R5CXD4_9FLAO|nr:hypothetical protein [Flavobacterium hiemivividum]TDE05462.1 hypothetical protein E0F98_04935 [Flavobacterium hiemivividum]
MFGLKNENTRGKRLTILFYSIALIEVITELLSDIVLVFIFKPLLSIGIMVLYWNASKERNRTFFVVLFLSMVTNILFIPGTENLLFMGLIVFLAHRLLLISYVVQLIKLKDYFPLFIAVLPFLFIFSYLLSISTEIQMKSYFVLIIQNVLISVIGGLALSQYAMNYNKMNSWLLIFGLLSVTQYFIVFIEKYYLSNIAPIAFRPLAMLLNASVYYVFYRFVIDAEKVNAESVILLDND